MVADQEDEKARQQKVPPLVEELERIDSTMAALEGAGEAWTPVWSLVG